LRPCAWPNTHDLNLKTREKLEIERLVLQKCSRNTALDRFLSLISPHPKQGTRKTPPRRRKNRSFLRIFRIIERLKSYTRTRQKYYERTVRIVKECDIIFTRCIYIRIDLSVFLVNKRIDRQVRIFSFSFRRITLHPFSFFFFDTEICHVTPVTHFLRRV